MKELTLGSRRIIIGRGSLQYLAQWPAQRVLIVTGGGSAVRSGAVGRIKSLLEQAGCTVDVYAGVLKNPDTEAILRGVAKLRAFAPETVVAVGGGSPLDAAQVMALFYEHPELTFENCLDGPLPERLEKVKLIAIPTTSGTGSEVTRSAVVTFKDRALKIGLKTDAFIPEAAILDADLTMTMPDHVVAETGMDALTHAVEAYINHDLDDFTECLARGAVEGIFTWLRRSYHEKTVVSREKMHHYQCMAGMAFANVGLGMAHGIAHAVGGRYDLGHGLVNAIVLPYVLQYNARDEIVKGKLQRLAKAVGVPSFIAAARGLGEALQIPPSFAAAGIAEADYFAAFDELAAASLLGSTRVNPVAPSREDMAELLKRLYYGVWREA